MTVTFPCTWGIFKKVSSPLMGQFCWLIYIMLSSGTLLHSTRVVPVWVAYLSEKYCKISSLKYFLVVSVLQCECFKQIRFNTRPTSAEEFAKIIFTDVTEFRLDLSVSLCSVFFCSFPWRKLYFQCVPPLVRRCPLSWHSDKCHCFCKAHGWKFW